MRMQFAGRCRCNNTSNSRICSSVPTEKPPKMPGGGLPTNPAKAGCVEDFLDT